MLGVPWHIIFHLGQSGLAHPQAPNSRKGRMFKVLKEVVEENTSASRGDSSISLGGRVRSEGAKQLLAKQLGKALDSFGGGMVDLKTGQIKSKKPKKEKTAEQLALAEAKTLLTKLTGLRFVDFFNFDPFISLAVH